MKNGKHTPGSDPNPGKGKDDQHGHKKDVHTGKPGKSHSLTTV